MQQEPESRERGQRAPLLGQVDDGHPVHPAAQGDRGPDRHVPAVDHDDDVRHGRVGGVVGEGAALREILRQQLGHVLPRRRDHAGGAGVVLDRVRPGVRRPLEPLPLPQRLLGGHHRHPQPARRRHGQQVHEQRPGQRAGGVDLADDLHTGEVVQRGPQRQAVDVAVSDHEARHGRQAHGVGLGQRVELLRHEIHAQGLGRAPQAHEHLVVAGTALPHPPAVLDEVGQRLRLGQDVHRVAPLLAGHRTHGVPQLGEVGEVLAPLVLDALTVLTRLAVDVDADHGQHGDHHAAAHEQGAVAVGVRDGHEDHDAHRTGQGQHRGQDARRVLSDDGVGRGLDIDGSRGALGGV